MTNRLLTLGLMLPLSALWAPAVAQSAEPEDPARVFTDPNFLPLAGELYGSTGYSFATLHGDQVDDSGARIGSVDIVTNTVSQQVGYGITDDLAVILADTYVPLSRRSVDPIGSPSFDRDRSGISDPSIEAIWRALDERDSPVLVDLSAHYSPNLVESQSADAAHEGSLGRGGQAAGFGVALGHEWTDWGVRGSATADWAGTRTTSDPSSPAFTREGSAWHYTLDLTSQVRFDDQVSANVGAGYDIRQGSDVTREPAGLTFATHPGNVGNLHASLNYQLLPGRAAASLLYQYNDYANRNVDFGAAAGPDNGVRNKTENVFGVKFDYALD